MLEIMPRPPRNQFYAILGIVGFAFTITAAAYCVSELRGVLPETSASRGEHALDRLMDLHGTTLLTAELMVLAIATVGAVWIDHVAGEKIRREREAARVPGPANTTSGTDEP